MLDAMTSRPLRTLRSILALLALAGASLAAWSGDRLTGTWGVSQVEGAGGGGLVPWALVAGSGSRDQIGATAFVTRLQTQGDYSLSIAGAAVGIQDSFEISASKWRFGLSDTVPGQSLRQDVIGLKWRVFGDAVFDQDRAWPQVAVGLQHKRNAEFGVPAALGARRASDTDFYVAATKVWLAGLAGRNTLANLSLRATRANQFGLLGFGGDLSDHRRLQAELSLAALLRDDLAIGAEWRAKPDNLSVFREERATDLFVAWFVNRHLSATLAWVDLGNIANKPGQRGAYLSLQAAL